jgi:cyclopropane-fatty-acyl-phospholipid synthase
MTRPARKPAGSPARKPAGSPARTPAGSPARKPAEKQARIPEGAADVIASLLKTHVGLDLPVRLRAWDGSEAGPAEPPGLPVVVIRSPQALRRILWRPGELGLARAYISGDLDLEGDLTEALRQVLSAIAAKTTPAPKNPSAPAPAAWTPAVLAPAAQAVFAKAAAARTAVAWTPAAWATARAAARLKVLGPPWSAPRPPACELRVSGRLHSRARDQAVIAGHYDVSAAFYQLILDPSMAYSCACWPEDGPRPSRARAQGPEATLARAQGPEATLARAQGPEATLADAQRAKLEMICRKLALEPGSKLLDMGCGWGSLTVHAARDYKAQVTAVTLSREQGGYVKQRVRGLGLSERAQVSIQDYRDATGGPYDAIASVEMGEHVGAANYPRFCAELHRLLRPGGRLLIQQMSRGARAPGGGPFIESYITPDMNMRPVGDTVRLIENAGFEVIGVEAMRNHYVRTIRAWLDNFEANIAEVRAILSDEQLRVWRLYLAGGALAFADGRMGVDQILAVRRER